MNTADTSYSGNIVFQVEWYEGNSADTSYSSIISCQMEGRQEIKQTLPNLTTLPVKWKVENKYSTNCQL